MITTTLALALLWLFARVTLVLLVVAGVYATLGRAAPRARSLVLGTGLGVTLGLTLLAASPWPNWWPVETVEADASATVAGTEVDGERSTASEHAAVAVDGSIDAATPVPAVELESTWAAFATGLVDSLRRPTVVDEATPPRSRPWWPGVVVGLFGAAAALGLVRMLAGWWAVSRLGSAGRPIDAPALAELVDLLRAEAGCRRPIALRESAAVSPAATFGWRRPVVLLAADWRTWTPDELRAVLAHEVAHVRRGDFLSLVCTELCLVLHFHHPLMHWLANRTRLEHELAADADAAEVTGGPRSYLRILAEMVLRQPNRRTSWAVAPFLPTRRTFTRRIEVLRESRSTTKRGTGRITLAAAVLLLVGTGIVAAGLQGAGTTQRAAAGNDDERPVETVAGDAAAVTPSGKRLDLAHIPRDVLFLYQFDVEALLSAPGIEPLREEIAKFEEERATLGVPVADMRRVSLTLVPEENGGERRLTGPLQEPLFVVHTKNDVEAETLAKFGYEPTVKDGGTAFFETQGGVIARPNARTLVYSTDAATVRYALMQNASATPPVWAEDLERVGDAHVVFFGNVAAFRKEAGDDFLEEMPTQLAFVSPLLANVNTIAAGVTLGSDLEIEVYASCVSDEGAKQVAETGKALLVLGRNFIKQARLADLGSAPRELRPALDELLALADQLVASLAIEQQGSLVQVTGTAKDVRPARIVTVLLPAIRDARTAARRAQAMNNLKQLALAMHNYHEQHGRFPPAVLTGPDGKTKYSWRVELLPYLEQAALYEQYDRTQPWDSEHNKKVLQTIVPTYKDPHEPADSTNTSYFALVGKGTLFDGAAGTPIRNITDGTSNSILLVSAKRDVPWTKPEDIEVDLSAEKLPELGGYYDDVFLVALCDGSVRAILRTIDPNVLRAVIGINDGRVVPEF